MAIASEMLCGCHTTDDHNRMEFTAREGEGGEEGKGKEQEEKEGGER